MWPYVMCRGFKEAAGGVALHLSWKYRVVQPHIKRVEISADNLWFTAIRWPLRVVYGVLIL